MKKRCERNKENNKMSRMLLFMILGISAVYMILLLNIVLFKYVRLGDIVSGSFNKELRSVSIIPFADLKDMILYGEIIGLIKNYIGNIGIFVPFGMILPLLFKKFNGIKVIISGFILSLFFEITQYILCLGASDTDDLLMNTLGAAIGYSIYSLINRDKDNIIKVRLISIIVLGCMGTAGIVAIYEIHPTAIAKQEHVEVNKEIIQGLSDECDTEGVIVGMDNDKLDVESYEYMDDDGNKIGFEKNNYNLIEDTKVYCLEIEGTYNAAGNVTKVTGIYSEMNMDGLREEIEKEEDKEIYGEIWLDNDDVKGIMITKYSEKR